MTVVISESANSQNRLHVIEESVKKKVVKLLKKISIKDVASTISKENNISKKVIYDFCLKRKMKLNKYILIIMFTIISGCVGYSSTGVLGTGVSIAWITNYGYSN